jgi:hypothetical protein
MFTLVIGTGTRQKPPSTVDSFSAIKWDGTPKYLKTEIYPVGGPWKDMGAAQLWSVPYSVVADSAKGIAYGSKLSVKSDNDADPDALFEVRRKDGQTVFAVYPTAVNVYVPTSAKGKKGGFAVGGFDGSKANPPQDYLRITPDSVRIYIDETVAKGTKGGFAVGGFGAKGPVNEFMFLTPENYFIGHKSGQAVTEGKYNSTLGYQSGKSLTEGSNNIFVGYNTGYTNTIGGSNVFIGNNAGFNNSSGNYNILLGRSAGYNNSTGWGNIALGDYADAGNTTGYQNVIIGDLAGTANSEGFQNVILGANAGIDNTTGSNNVFIGSATGSSNTTGNYNSFLGFEAGFGNTTGKYNTFLGYQAGYSSGISSYSTSIGYKAGYSLSNWQGGTYMGFEAGMNSTGRQNVFLGSEAGRAYTTGADNVAIGGMAGGSNDSPFLQATGWRNVLIGYHTGYKSASATDNVIIGAQDPFGVTHITGSYNVYLGVDAGNQSSTASRNVFIGYNAGKGEIWSDKLVIENNYTGNDNASNALIYGDFSSNLLRFNGSVGVNASPGAAKLNVVDDATTIAVKGVTSWSGSGDHYGIYGYGAGGSSYNHGVYGYAYGGSQAFGFYGIAGGASEWTIGVFGTTFSGTGQYAGYFSGDLAYTGGIYHVSDENFKKNIEPISGALGKILKLNVISYQFKSKAELSFVSMKSDGDTDNDAPSVYNFPEGKQIGVIAQDLEKVIPELVKTNPDGYKMVDYVKLVPVLVEAIKEQQKQIEELKTIVNSLISSRSAQVNK